MKTNPMTMLLAMMAGWLNRQQQEALAYLKEENKILRDGLLKATGKKRIILNDSQAFDSGRPVTIFSTYNR